jgi:phosphatidylserine synthase
MKNGNKRNEIFLTITHALTVLVVLLKGISKVNTPGKSWIGLLFIGIALFLAFGTIYYHRFEKILKHFKAYTFCLESIVLALVGYMYVKEGKHFIQYVCFLASIMYIIALIVYLRRRRNL